MFIDHKITVLDVKWGGPESIFGIFNGSAIPLVLLIEYFGL